MKKFLFIAGLFVLSLIIPVGQVKADNGISLSPYVIDEKVKARDILEYDIKIKNNSQSRATLYAVVGDVTEDGGFKRLVEPETLDKAVYVSRWIEISRAVIEIDPGKEKAIPLRIKVNMYAKPGKRYGIIAFANSVNYYDAEAQADSSNLPKVAINLEVTEDLIEKAELTSFRTEQTVFFKQPVDFYLEVNNIGNVDITPIGNIRIYDRRGAESGNLDINADKNNVKGNNNYIFKSPWQQKNGFGKYKAKLEIEYGKNGDRDLQDVIYFWILPWQFLAGFALMILILFILLYIALRRGKNVKMPAYSIPIAQNEDRPVEDIKINKIIK